MMYGHIFPQFFNAMAILFLLLLNVFQLGGRDIINFFKVSLHKSVFWVE